MLNLTNLLFIISVLMGLVNSEKFEYVDCCEIPDITRISKEVQAKCPLNKNLGGQQEHLRAMVCQANCLAQQLNIVDGDHIDKQKFEYYVDDLMADNVEAKQFYNDTIFQCEKEVFAMKKMIKMPKMECSMKTYGEIVCIANALLFKCPEDKLIKTPECDEQRQLFKTMSEQVNQ